jgi:hypothetical protein
MANDTKFIHNVETDEILVIELTDEEQAQLDAERQIAVKAKEQAKLNAQAKRKAASDKLAALGLEPDDLEVLGLG